ncbi:BAM_G0005950.mRNA.1.CDS.1 [Saccharomyces cerevisiae]|nr:BAM_G0005950.mRNA.1.CDS.1 [Saccharomyces cerevisiae]CAI7055668.1 BAM_G0005950.mRNA.1.CDS.1 [Saccharomyces cerevisiae]
MLRQLLPLVPPDLCIQWGGRVIGKKRKEIPKRRSVRVHLETLDIVLPLHLAVATHNDLMNNEFSDSTSNSSLKSKNVVPP